jgi:transcriptional regulator with XRE-family HTH domain
MTMQNNRIAESDHRILQIGNYIRMLRKQNTKLSAEDFAYENGFDRVQYSRIEKGANITMKTLLKVLDAHHLSLKDFLGSFEELEEKEAL